MLSSGEKSKRKPNRRNGRRWDYVRPTKNHVRDKRHRDKQNSLREDETD